MTRLGYTLMSEQAGPRELVRYAAAAEEAGFDFEVISDHYFPWLDAQGHSPYAWSVLGAVCQVTEQVGLMTYVTCPTLRYHPTVVAQKAATVQLLSDGRFTLGLGSGENLNEHVVGAGWPHVNKRHEMLTEAIEIISKLFDGDMVDYHGRHFTVDSAKLWDLHERRVDIGVAVSGDQSIQRFAPRADHLIAVEPDPELIGSWKGTQAGLGRQDSRSIGQLPISWDRDVERARTRAHEQFRWFGGGWHVNANLPTTAAFAAASQFITVDDVAEAIPCGPDIDPILEAVDAYWDAGFTDVALVQVGAENQDEFLTYARTDLLPALRERSPGR